MTLAEILDKIKRYYPKAATWADADIVSIINDEQREIFRELQLEEIYEFETVKNQAIYSLPTNCDIEGIEYVGVAKDATITDESKFTEYKFADRNEILCGYRYFDSTYGLIGLYPVPDEAGWNVRLIYRKRPTMLSVDNTLAKPDLKEDWHRILVYAVIAEIAGSGSNPDVTTANNYTLKYNTLMREIQQSRYERLPKYPCTKDVMKKRPRDTERWAYYLNPYA